MTEHIIAQPMSIQRYKATIKAWCTDVLIWSYSCIVLFKIAYQQWWLDLRYVDFSWHEPLYCFVVAMVLASVLIYTRCSIGKALFGLITFKEGQSIFRASSVRLALVKLLLTFAAGLHVSQVSMHEFLSPSGLAGAQRIFSALLSPNFAIFEDALFAAIETVYMAFVATALAIPVAFVLAFFAARNLMKHSAASFALYAVIRFFMNLTRSIEPLVWAIIFSVWVGIGPFSGMLALFLHSVASLTKLYSEQIEAIHDGPVEAMTATGAHPVQVIWYGVVPQIILPYLSYTIYRWDINVRMATVIGLVGGGGIGTMLMQYQGLARWNEVGMLVIVIATIVWLMDYASARIRAHLK
ncbi:phosphonate ABC transporter, permease protein PhnE [Alkalimonas collagenimarina]|uniref:Phosphonate ABC transporter, permease protein PhnE n=1 Tax=Alkalimonas collagenimarina TaxID=400390 RepID=A0ABT9H253_9GAMM|nr:phosphonate ABC transporter, permease protein PhnE [Alkalimonas collagenimarina]MDP4537390.1 phosphonate ABC transporter, permease protein PhnE [Alkalimonas collagenimarina]